ncbi:hypothetical protein SPRG_12549 [Saprolegnia parasitica CBS 223.65]|uniref:Ubiquitin-like protease family profile domain-containing protein n=1 Tax=Saprolegnia parasitica (strain CBS 223.65) TaxID=695850 RepID=A0A067BVL4_SAPPC|nr:hypothetical protein SPRG_12549 [Saprolegnia parasitica CBS 223.65]KDO22569.1 hypothetical protein SPRG_12549 [Saprolegnia parasitica CBS 223.65]|eukprot:XP_012206685.1 hypothetical protein SPRG_12549 [Saprolegnia parasitica CBS 223.65]
MDMPCPEAAVPAALQPGKPPQLDAQHLLPVPAPSPTMYMYRGPSFVEAFGNKFQSKEEFKTAVRQFNALAAPMSLVVNSARYLKCNRGANKQRYRSVPDCPAGVKCDIVQGQYYLGVECVDHTHHVPERLAPIALLRYQPTNKVAPTIVPEATALTVEPEVKPTVEPALTVEPTLTVEPEVEPEVEPTVEPALTVEPTVEPIVPPARTDMLEADIRLKETAHNQYWEDNILMLDIVFIPVNVGNSHWFLIAIDVSRRRILVFDMFAQDRRRRGAEAASDAVFMRRPSPIFEQGPIATEVFELHTPDEPSEEEEPRPRKLPQKAKRTKPIADISIELVARIVVWIRKETTPASSVPDLN